MNIIYINIFKSIASWIEMKILLVSPSQRTVYGSEMKPSYAPLGLLYIAACLEKESHKVEFLDFDNDYMDRNKFKNFVLRFKPEVVGITSTTSTINHAKQIARDVKNISNIPIIVGGIHATIAPEDILKEDFIDFIVVGEGEVTIIKLIKEQGILTR